MKAIALILSTLLFQFSFGQEDEAHYEKEDRNYIGVSFSLGKSTVYHKKAKSAFSGSLNYSLASRTGDWQFEFGTSYTQINYTTDKEYSSYFPLSDTFRIRTGNLLYFDTPINFQRITSITDKTDILVNIGWFFTTYIKWFERTERYLTADESFIDQNKKIIKPFNYFKMGFDFGVGIKQRIAPSSLICLSIHLNIRSGLGAPSVFPNLTFGYKYQF